MFFGIEGIYNKKLIIPPIANTAMMGNARVV
jgi:hypothetical protein